MRTGSVGNRSAEDMVKTLVEPKKTAVSSIREKLLSAGYSEEVEYDSINIEPVLIYSVSETNRLFVKHKWDLTALLPVRSDAMKQQVLSFDPNLAKYEFVDDDNNSWLKFKLPNDEELILKVLKTL